MGLPSHSYACTAPELARVLAVPAGGALALVVLLHLAVVLDLLPAPTPADLDHTLLAEKARLASRAEPASVVLIGDSSCLMNVDAVELTRILGESALNLATLSYLDLEANGDLLERYLKTHPTPAKVVLLLHPEALWRADATPSYVQYLRSRLDDRGSRGDAGHERSLSAWLATEVLRERVVQPWVGSPVKGEFAVEYGTTFEVARRLRTGRGSLVDPSHFQPLQAGVRTEYRLGKRMEAASKAFHERLPQGLPLIVGITAVPSSLAPRDFDDRSREMLASWSTWIGADGALADLPMTLPDDQFATHTHLNAVGRADYTRRLADALKSAGGLLVQPVGVERVPIPTPLPLRV